MFLLLLLLFFLSKLSLRFRLCHTGLRLPNLLDFRLWFFGSFVSSFLFGLLLINKLLHGLIELLFYLSFIGWLCLKEGLKISDTLIILAQHLSCRTTAHQSFDIGGIQSSEYMIGVIVCSGMITKLMMGQ